MVGPEAGQDEREQNRVVVLSTWVSSGWGCVVRGAGRQWEKVGQWVPAFRRGNPEGSGAVQEKPTTPEGSSSRPNQEHNLLFEFG